MRQILFAVALLVLVAPVVAQADEDSGAQITPETLETREFCKGADIEPEEGWARISVKSVFDATRSGAYIAIIEIDGRRRFIKEGARFSMIERDGKRMFVKEGQPFEEYTVLRIDGKKSCVTVAKRPYESKAKPRPREQPVPPRKKAKPKENEIDPKTESMEAAKEFCLDDEQSKPEEGWPKIIVKSIFDPTRSGNYIAIIEFDGRRMLVKEGESFNKYKIVRIDGEKKCVSIIRRKQNGEDESDVSKSDADD